MYGLSSLRPRLQPTLVFRSELRRLRCRRPSQNCNYLAHPEPASATLLTSKFWGRHCSIPRPSPPGDLVPIATQPDIRLAELTTKAASGLEERSATASTQACRTAWLEPRSTWPRLTRTVWLALRMPL